MVGAVRPQPRDTVFRAASGWLARGSRCAATCRRATRLTLLIIFIALGMVGQSASFAANAPFHVDESKSTISFILKTVKILDDPINVKRSSPRQEVIFYISDKILGCGRLKLIEIHAWTKIAACDLKFIDRNRKIFISNVFELYNSPASELVSRRLAGVLKMNFDHHATSSFKYNQFSFVSENVSSELAPGDMLGNGHMCGSRVGVAGGNLQGILGALGGFKSGVGGYPRQVETVEQAADPEDGKERLNHRPEGPGSRSVRGLPLGAKVGTAVLLTFWAWGVIFRSWDLFDGFNGRERNRSLALGLFSAGLGLLGLSLALLIWAFGDAPEAFRSFAYPFRGLLG